jgi:hypothetical protein
MSTPIIGIWAEAREKFKAELKEKFKAEWLKNNQDPEGWEDAFELEFPQLYEQEMSRLRAEDSTAQEKERRRRAKITGFEPHNDW